MYDDLNSYLIALNFDANEDTSVKASICRDAVKHANAAYQNASPVISDDDYVKLIQLTNELESKLGLDLTSDCSDTMYGDTLKPMYSLNKVYGINDLIGFLDKFNSDDIVVIEPKLDGVSATMCYRNDSFSHMQLKTRVFSQEETLQLPIRNIHNIVNAQHMVGSVDVRGEVVIELDKYDDLSPIYKNARTVVAAMLNTSDISALHYPEDLFDFVVFEVMPAVDVPSCFQMVNSYTNTKDNTIKDIAESNLEQYINKEKYLLDGLVFKMKDYEHLGYTKKYPRNHIAFKHSSEVVAAKIVAILIKETEKNIRKSVRVQIEPTGVGGIIVNYINVGSENALKLFNLKVGDYLKFRLSGGIIPVVVGKAE